MTTATKRKHIWIRNPAFARLTGIKKVCMDCGQPSNTADKVCPGAKTETGDDK